jgi:hypothetical protein
MYPYWIVLAWAVISLALAALWLLLAPQPAPAVIDLRDPYAADVAEFRRQVGDWDHGGA